MRMIVCAVSFNSFACEIALACLYDPTAARRPVNLNLNGDLVTRARREKLNLSAIAEAAIGCALARIASERFRADIARAVVEHDEYLSEFGSLGAAVRAMGEDH